MQAWHSPGSTGRSFGCEAGVCAPHRPVESCLVAPLLLPLT